MPKHKKRRKDDSVQSLAKSQTCNLTGFGNGDFDGSDSLAACMAEFEPNDNKEENEDTQELENEGTSAKKTASTSRWEEGKVDSDRVEAWNRSLMAWIQSGRYTPLLLPSIDEELARHFQVQEISKFLLAQGNDLRMPLFERFLLDSRLEDVKSRDPVLPMWLQPHKSEACLRLGEELVQHGINREKAEDVVAELCRKINVAGQELASKAERYQITSPLKGGDRMDLEDHESTVTLIYARKRWKKPFCFSLNTSHYEKLKDRFFRLHGKSDTKLDEGSKKVLRSFHVLVVALMLRYSSMSGGQLLQDLRGGGMQGAIHDKVFKLLREEWGRPWVEGFASPFNVCLSVFGSAYPDLDWHFGSIGSFWDVSLVREEGCCCEANPPFSPGVMTKMVDHIIDQLEKADRFTVPLTFVVVIPTAGAEKDRAVQKAAGDSFQRMVRNEFCRLHIQLAARNHGYVEGAQHLRPTRYKQSSYDTSVIILQSKIDRQRKLDEKEFEKRVKTAFASQHEEELNKRKKSLDSD
jgi:phosphorylated CTD-interacting factor 1